MIFEHHSFDQQVVLELELYPVVAVVVVDIVEVVEGDIVVVVHAD